MDCLPGKVSKHPIPVQKQISSLQAPMHNRYSQVENLPQPAWWMLSANACGGKAMPAQSLKGLCALHKDKLPRET